MIHLLLALLSPAWAGVTIPSGQKLDGDGDLVACTPADWGYKDAKRNCPVPPGQTVKIPKNKKLDGRRYFAKCDPADAGRVDTTHNCPRLPPPPPSPPPSLTWVKVPAGSGQIGDDKDGHSDEQPAFRVVFTRSFEMLETEVTNRQYARVVSGHQPVDDEPVVNVTWHQAKAWCEAAGGRLPTELEWEYATRAGGEGAYGLGQGGEGVTTLNLRSYAWLSPTDEVDSKATTHPVKQKKPNAWGLYDLWGNVWEWTLDGYEDTAWKQLQASGRRDDTSDKVVITDTGFVDTIDNAPPDLRVNRGGSAWSGPRLLRSGYRDWDSPSSSGGVLGFRCVRAPARHPLNLTN